MVRLLLLCCNKGLFVCLRLEVEAKGDVNTHVHATHRKTELTKKESGCRHRHTKVWETRVLSKEKKWMRVLRKRKRGGSLKGC